MTPIQKAAVKKALEALERLHYDEAYRNWKQENDAIAALHAALAETAEPVARSVLIPRSLALRTWEFLAQDCSPCMSPECQILGKNESVDGLVDEWDSVLKQPADHQPPAPAVELTDEDLSQALMAAMPRPSLFPYLKGDAKVGPVRDAIFAICRAAIAAHEAKKGSGMFREAVKKSRHF